MSKKELSQTYRSDMQGPERKHSLPTTTLLLSPSQLNDAVTHPVPEFLCHLFSMLRDTALANLITWAVPIANEPDEQGGGIANIGKIVVHNPTGLQEEVLGKYYRHSKYASFQRQLNYFGFKKRLHGGKKGKLSPCSYVHEKLGPDPSSLFQLKRRPPANKRVNTDSTEASCAGVVAKDTKQENASPSLDAKRKKNESSKPTKRRRLLIGEKKEADNRQSLPRLVSRSSNVSVASTALKTLASVDSKKNDEFELKIAVPPVLPQVVKAEVDTSVSVATGASSSTVIPIAISSTPASAKPPLVRNTLLPNVNTVATSRRVLSLPPSAVEGADEMTPIRADAAVREAQRALERAYRKSGGCSDLSLSLLNNIGATVSKVGTVSSMTIPATLTNRSVTTVPIPAMPQQQQVRTTKPIVPQTSMVPNPLAQVVEHEVSCPPAPIYLPSPAPVTPPAPILAAPTEVPPIIPGLVQHQPTMSNAQLSQILSLSLPPTDELFNDESNMDLFQGVVSDSTDNSLHHSNSLVNLAMIY
jgi:hypothetical protein